MRNEFRLTIQKNNSVIVCSSLYKVIKMAIQCKWPRSRAMDLIPGGPPPPQKKKKKKHVDTVDLQSTLLLLTVIFFSPCWIKHLFLIIITQRSSNLVENFLFYE